MSAATDPSLDPILRATLASAKRRLTIRRYLSLLPIVTSVLLLISAIVVLVCRLTGQPLPLGRLIVGAIALSGVVTAATAWRRRATSLDAALALDRAFQLKERFSTLVSLATDPVQHPMREILEADVRRRTASLPVAEQLPIRLPRHAWMPAVPLALTLLATLTPPWKPATGSPADPGATEVTAAQIAEQGKELARRLEERKQELPKGDSEAAEQARALADRIAKTSEKLANDKKGNADEAAVTLANLTRQVEEQRDRLANQDAMQRQFQKLGEAGAGPAEAMTRALKQGNFGEAAKQLADLRKKVEEKKLDPAQKEKLAEQLARMEQELSRLANQQDRAEQLKNSLQGKELQRELEKLAADKEKLKQMQQLAQQLGQCARCAGGKPGENGEPQAGGAPGQQPGDLADALKQAEQLLKEMQGQSQLRDTLDQMLADLDGARQGICEGCQGKDGKNGPPQAADYAEGGGRGAGKRAERPDETRSREQQSRSKTEPRGPIEIVGRVEGPTFKGQSLAEVRDAAAKAAATAEEAITRQNVPREYQKHTQDYFDQLNGQLNR